MPLASVINENISEGYNSIAHFVNAVWWRIRLFSKRIKWNLFDKQFFENFKYIFNSDLQERKKVQEDIEGILTPLLGLIGFCFTGLFTPIKSWFKLTGNDNRLINSLASIGTTTQHLAYFFRFTLPELFKAQENQSKESELLFGVGACANAMNTFLPAVEMISSGDGTFGKIQKLFRELSIGFTMAFFSARRHIMGRQWLETNSTT